MFQRSNPFGKHGLVAIPSRDALVCFHCDVYQVILPCTIREGIPHKVAPSPVTK